MARVIFSFDQCALIADEIHFYWTQSQKSKHRNGNRSSGKKEHIMHFLDTGCFMEVFIAGMIIDIPFG